MTEQQQPLTIMSIVLFCDVSRCGYIFVCQLNLLQFILLHCIDFPYGCICAYSDSFYCCYKPLTLHWVFAILWSFPFFFNFLFFSLFYNFNFLNLLYFLHLFFCLPFLLFSSPCNQSLMYINLPHLPLFNFAYLFFFSFLSFLATQHIC